MPPQVIALGEAIVEIMRDTVGVPLDVPGTFVGPYPSGAPAIFASAAARLGVPTGLIGCVGDDDFGRCFVAHCRRDGLDTSYLVTLPGLTTGTAFVTYLQDGSRRFVFHLAQAAAGRLVPQMLHRDYFANVQVVHITGSTLAINDGCRAACLRAAEWAKEAGAWVSFDPNCRVELLGTHTVGEICGPILELADIVLPSGEEATMLAGQHGLEPYHACRLLLERYPAHLVVLKEGANGSTAFGRDGMVLHVNSWPTVEVDPTGAGDCFAAALLTGLRGDLPLPTVLRRANAAGALATTQRGPMEGAPTAAKLDRLLNGDEPWPASPQ